MAQVPERVPTSQRLAAVGAFALGIGVVVLTVRFVAEAPLWVVVQLALLNAATLAAWRALTRLGWRRAVAAVIALAAVVGSLLVGIARDEGGPVTVVIRIAALVLAVSLARYALALDVRSLRGRATPGVPVPPATRGVLMVNPRSGGGKAERYRLVEACRSRGIEAVVLRPGDDLLRLARDAADRGADVIGMAGGDGSQALVASVAADRGLSMVVIPAGTRNHLALDLGLDREDVVGALDAFGDAVERVIDLAEVNGRVFVNNVSLGLYAVIVHSSDYRDNKLDTTLATLPKVLAPGTESFDLRYRGPGGEEHRGAHVIQISNNPYRGKLVALASRPRLDAGVLGVVTLEIRKDEDVPRFLSALAIGHPERFRGFRAWSAPTFEVSSGGPIDVGLDGEMLAMGPPLRFAIRPGALRVRLPPHAIGLSPAARIHDVRTAARSLWQIAMGRPASVVV